jgi:hypothetical protein
MFGSLIYCVIGEMMRENGTGEQMMIRVGSRGHQRLVERFCFVTVIFHLEHRIIRCLQMDVRKTASSLSTITCVTLRHVKLDWAG